MDVLENKKTKSYNYTSRYATFPYYYHKEDGKYVYGLTSNLSQQTEHSIHYLTDSDTLDSLALKYYGRPDLFWVIADFNRINDPYITLTDRFNFVYIPSLSGIRWLG